MATYKTASKLLQKSPYLLLALLMTACQPSSPTDAAAADSTGNANNEKIDTPLIITDDSVTMTRDHILSIKPSRYQPSLGLQGKIEPIKQVKLITAHPVKVEEILVSEGQWVEKGTPLFIVRRQHELNQTTSSADTAAIDASTNDKANSSANVKELSTTNPAINDAAVSDSAKAKLPYNLVTMRASFSGYVKNLYAATGQSLSARMPILQLSDETKLHFTATLPIQAKPQLSVGQTVNFTAEDSLDKFTGQVSKLMTTSQPKTLLVYVNVIDNELSRNKLLPNMTVTGRVDYGQIDVGTIVPKHALHDVDLTELKSPPFKPLRSLTANVWVIGQDQRLIRQPIEVIEYDPTTNQYLIAGISNDSLICLADLPVDSKGKKVIVS